MEVEKKMNYAFYSFLELICRSSSKIGKKITGISNNNNKKLKINIAA